MTLRAVATRTGALLAAVAVLGAGTPARADAADDRPLLRRADVAVTMNSDGDDTVRSTFRLATPVSRDTGIRLRAMPRRDSEVADLTAVDGLTGVDTTSAGDTTASVPAGTATFTIEHAVERDSGSRAAVLAAPDIDTARNAKVGIEVTLPRGQRLVGDSMPSFHATRGPGDRVRLEHAGGALPAVVVADYGTESGISRGTVVSIVGLGALAAVFAVRFLWPARPVRGEGRRP